MRVAGLDLLGASAQAEYIEFGNARSLLDYDLVIWNTAFPIKGYCNSHKDSIQGNRYSLEPESARKLKADVHRRKAELDELRQYGRTTVVLVTPDIECFIPYLRRHPVSKNFIRDGVQSYNPVREALGVDKYQPVLATGKRVEFRGSEEWRPLWEAIRVNLEYKAYLPSGLGRAFLFIQGSPRPVGAVVEHAGAGSTIFLPYLEKSTSADVAAYVRALVAAIKKLQSRGQSELPVWAAKTVLPGERETRARLQELESQMSALEEESRAANSSLREIEGIKRALSATGSELEKAIQSVLVEIGFNVESSGGNQSDLVISHDGRFGVVEVKGVGKSAAQSHAAQLETWRSQIAEERKIDVDSIKPILIVNAFNSVPIDERSQPPFPDQMLPYCNRRDHCLVTSTQLLCLYKYVKENPEKREQCLREFFSTVGIYNRFPDAPVYLGLTTDSATTAGKIGNIHSLRSGSDS